MSSISCQVKIREWFPSTDEIHGVKISTVFLWLYFMSRLGPDRIAHGISLHGQQHTTSAQKYFFYTMSQLWSITWVLKVELFRPRVELLEMLRCLEQLRVLNGLWVPDRLCCLLVALALCEDTKCQKEQS